MYSLLHLLQTSTFLNLWNHANCETYSAISQALKYMNNQYHAGSVNTKHEVVKVQRTHDIMYIPFTVIRVIHHAMVRKRVYHSWWSKLSTMQWRRLNQLSFYFPHLLPISELCSDIPTVEHNTNPNLHHVLPVLHLLEDLHKLQYNNDDH